MIQLSLDRRCRRTTYDLISFDCVLCPIVAFIYKAGRKPVSRFLAPKILGAGAGVILRALTRAFFMHVRLKIYSNGTLFSLQTPGLARNRELELITVTCLWPRRTVQCSSTNNSIFLWCMQFMTNLFKFV